MTALQYRMLELVLEIDEICKKHNITYYLSGGSVLGAVRHKGFIPWDDDIDIMMTRQEFARFQEVCKTDMRDDREIITMVNTPCHTKVTIKYMNKSTSQFFRSQVLDTTGCGISLDIMILDPLPRDEKQKEQHIAEYIVYNELLTPFFMVNAYLYKHVDLYNEYHARIQQEGKDAVMQELYTRLFVDEPAESDLYLYRWGQQLLIYEHRLFGEPRYMEFEGYMLPVPRQTLDFLRATYGDNWIYLPPEQQRETHVSFINTNVAYCNWLKDIQPFLNRPKVLSDFVTRKKHNVKKAVPAHDMAVYNYRQGALMIALELENAYEALSKMDDKALIASVGSYLSLQLDSGYIKNSVYIDIPDRTAALILNALIRMGDYAKADKILKLRRGVSRPMTEELTKAGQLIDVVRSMVHYFEDRRLDASALRPIDDVAAELLELNQNHPKQINFHRCVLELYTIAEQPADEMKNAIARALEAYPEDPEIAFWAGCLQDKLGDHEVAAGLFAKAKSTTNGVIMMKLKERVMEGTTK